MMCTASSTTWSNHLRILCDKYFLPNPLALMQNGQVWTKEDWKCLIKTKVIIHYEKELRTQSLFNSKMKYLNVSLSGLSRQPHPPLLNIRTTQDVKKLRIHLKFLTGDYCTAERLAIDQPSLDPHCKLCLANGITEKESIAHILTTCHATSEIRRRIYPDLLNTVLQVQPTSKILENPSSEQLTQFILDCTSLNLNDSLRVPSHNPNHTEIFQVARDWCFAISNERMRLIRNLKLKHNKHNKGL